MISEISIVMPWSWYLFKSNCSKKHPSKHSSWWRRLVDVFCFCLQKTSLRRLDQDEYASRLFQDVFKTYCKNVFKTSSRRLQNVFKTSLRRLQDVLQRYLQDVFKAYHQVKLFLLTRLWEAFNTFLRRSFPKTIVYRGICPSNTTSDKFMVSVQSLQER